MAHDSNGILCAGDFADTLGKTFACDVKTMNNSNKLNTYTFIMNTETLKLAIEVRCISPHVLSACSGTDDNAIIYDISN